MPGQISQNYKKSSLLFYYFLAKILHGGLLTCEDAYDFLFFLALTDLVDLAIRPKCFFATSNFLTSATCRSEFASPAHCIATIAKLNAKL